jgi:hypothetical protein
MVVVDLPPHTIQQVAVVVPVVLVEMEEVHMLVVLVVLVDKFHQHLEIPFPQHL